MWSALKVSLRCFIDPFRIAVIDMQSSSGLQSWLSLLEPVPRYWYVRFAAKKGHSPETAETQKCQFYPESWSMSKIGCFLSLSLICFLCAVQQTFFINRFQKPLLHVCMIAEILKIKLIGWQFYLFPSFITLINLYLSNGSDSRSIPEAPFCWFGISCVLKTFTFECWLIPSINISTQYQWTFLSIFADAFSIHEPGFVQMR